MAACIFCGSRPTTKEHTWAQWLRQYVPMPADSHHQGFAEVHLERIRQHPQKRVSGDLRRRAVKCVCASCYNGWMSALQESNKNTLIAVATGRPILLSAESQILLATWIAVFATCSEHRDPRRVTINKSISYIIWKRQVPPPTWGIWIAQHEPGPQWRSLLKHYALMLSDDLPNGTKINPEIQRPNSQTTTFSVGRMLAHVVGSNFDSGFAAKTYRLEGPKRIFRLWPLETDSLYWAPPQSLTDVEAHRLGDGLFEASAQRPIFRDN